MITIESIALAAGLKTLSAILAVKIYQQANTATLEPDDDYSIPSLIWPPPNMTNVPLHDDLLLGGVARA